MNWLLLTFVVKQRFPMEVSRLWFSQCSSCSTRLTNPSAVLAERVTRHIERSGDWFVTGTGGASSSRANAFVPPIPKLFSPARRGVVSVGKSRSSVLT
jgi:hypothetical protein